MKFRPHNTNTIIKSGGLITLLLLLPNFVWMALPRKAMDAETQAVPILLTVLENLARVVVFVLPFFYRLDLQKKHAAHNCGTSLLGVSSTVMTSTDPRTETPQEEWIQ